jgi:hypothetical protein
MFIVSRRILQKSLDALSEYTSREQLSDLVKRLNRRDGSAFPACWEVLVLLALYRVGHLIHEKPLRDGRRPDIAFTYADNSGEGFIADVTTVSDANRHRENPVDAFTLELGRVARETGVDANRLSFRVGRDFSGQKNSRKISLLLPSEDLIADFIRQRFMIFLKDIADAPLTEHAVAIEEPGISVKLVDRI